MLKRLFLCSCVVALIMLVALLGSFKEPANNQIVKMYWNSKDLIMDAQTLENRGYFIRTLSTVNNQIVVVYYK